MVISQNIFIWQSECTSNTWLNNNNLITSYNISSKSKELNKQKMGLLLIILINVELICGVVCKIETGLNLFPFSSPLLGWDIAGTHMVISTNTPVGHLEFYDFGTSYLTALPWPTLGGIVMVSTHESNRNNSYCMIYQLSNSRAQRISANSSCTNGTNYSFNVMLSSWGFGQDVDAYYLSYPANPGSYLLWGVNVTYTNSTFAQGYEVTYQQYYNNTIFYVARSLANSQSMNLVIYVNSSGIIQPNSSFLYPNCPAMTLDVYLEYLAVNCGNYVQIRSSYQPYSFLRNITPSATADAIAIVNNTTLIIVTTTNQIHQFNLLDGSLLDIINISLTTPRHIKRVGIDRFYLFNSTHGVIYTTSLTTACPNPCNCTNQYFTQSCPPNSFNNSNNLTNFSNPNHVPSVTTSWDWRWRVRVISEVLGNSLAVLSLRFTMKSNIPLSLFMEEFWLYKYYANATYPEGMALFMQEVEIVNLLKLKPIYMQFISLKFSIGSSSYYSSVYASNHTSYSPLYFSEATKEFCTISIALSLIVFALLRLVCTLFTKRFRQSNCLARVLYGALRERTRWWVLLMGVIESDFMVLCLYSLSQISLPFCFCFENKINLMAAVASFLVLLLYGTVAYTLLHEAYRRKTASMLIFSKHNSMRSYCLESAVLLTVKLFKGFAHSVLFASLASRFVLLASLDCLLITFIVLYRSFFQNRVHFFTYLMYQVGVGIVDAQLALKSAGLIENFSKFDSFINNTMVAILLIVVLKLFLIFSKALQELWLICFPNKVHSIKKPPELQTNNRPNLLQKGRKLQIIRPQVFVRGESSQYPEGIFQTSNKSRFIVRVKSHFKKDKCLKNYEHSKFAPCQNSKHLQIRY